MSDNNYYQVLNVDPDASDKEIKASYRKLAFKYHPDRNEGNKQAADKMKAINEAYAVLSDPEKRGQYDMLYRQYGDGANRQFRQTFSEQDIFRGSDIQQIFEEMARTFGLRGFEDIFKDFYGQNFQKFEFRRDGMFGRGFVYRTHSNSGHSVNIGKGFPGGVAGKILRKITGIYLPQRGEDLNDVIVLHPDFALQGGPYAYRHMARRKKLVVQIPRSVKEGQLIRLKGMGKEGTHGAESGDLLLKVKIRKPLIERLKNIIRLDS